MIDPRAPDAQSGREMRESERATESHADETLALELARRGAAGELAAAQELLELLWPALSRVVVGVLGAAHPDLEDAIQQSLIAFVHALPSFRGECHPAGFGCRIAFRVACRTRRHWLHDRARRDDFARRSMPPELAESPSEHADAERRRGILRELLADLPEEQAEALALRVVMGWSLEEVARATGAPQNTVRSRVRLAKEALRRRLESEPNLAEDVRLGA